MPAGIGILSGEDHLKVLIVTDAWAPQVNGVVRTLETLGRDLTALGHEVRYATPEGRFTVPMPTYPEIRLAIFPRSGLEKEIREFAPDAIHIATEGTLGLSARAICIKYAIPYTTSFHTRFPGICARALPFHPGGDGLPLPALVPCARDRDDGGDAFAQARDGGARFQEPAHLVARRRRRALPPDPRRVARRCGGRSGSMSAASRWRRTSRRSSPSTCPAPRS